MDYKTLYFTLSSRVTDAIDHLDAQNYGLALDCLVITKTQCDKLSREIDQSE